MDYMEKIKAEREDADESQRDIAKALNIPQSQYQKYEAKINALPIRYLIDICHHYKVSADYLLDIPSNYRHPRLIKGEKHDY